MTLVNSGTLFGPTLGLESDCTEGLRTPWCDGIAVRLEHTAEAALLKYRPIFHPELSEGSAAVGKKASHLASNTKWMIGGHHLLEEVANRRQFH